jgi:hypothetical protein
MEELNVNSKFIFDPTLKFLKDGLKVKLRKSDYYTSVKFLCNSENEIGFKSDEDVIRGNVSN